MFSQRRHSADFSSYKGEVICFGDSPRVNARKLYLLYPYARILMYECCPSKSCILLITQDCDIGIV